MNINDDLNWMGDSSLMVKKVYIYALSAAFCLFAAIGPAAAEAPPAITLPEGLKIVAEEGRVVRIAKFSEAMAEADSHMARAGLLPTINAQASRTSMAHQPAMAFGGQAVPTSDAQYYAYSISIQQILFDFRGSLSRYEAGRMILEARKFDTVRTKNAVALEFTMTFYDFLEADHLVAVADKEIERLEAHLRDANRLYKGGVMTKNDLLQVQVRLSDARQKQLSVKNLQAIRGANLNNLLLRPLNTEIQVRDNPKTIVPPSGDDLETARKEVLKRRPEILIVDRTLSAIDLEVTAQRSELLPKLYVRGSNDYMENSYQLHENNWSLTLGVNVNLFDGGRSLADLQKTKHRRKQLLEQRAKLADEIKLELQRYNLDLQNAYARILANQDASGQARENLRINKKRYEEGVGTATEVLDAVTLLTTAETNVIRSQYDYRKAEAATHYAAGTNLLDVYK